MGGGRGGEQVTAGFHTSGWWWWGGSWNNYICLMCACLHLKQNFMTWVPILKPSALSKGVNRLDWAALAWQKTKRTIPFTGTKHPVLPPLQPPSPIPTTPPSTFFTVTKGHQWAGGVRYSVPGPPVSWLRWNRYCGQKSELVQMLWCNVMVIYSNPLIHNLGLSITV